MKAILTVGISASSKTTWAEEFVAQNSDWANINRDDIRFSHFCKGERNWRKYNWKHEKEVNRIFYRELDLVVENRLNVIISDTNLNPKYRNILIDQLKEYGYEVEIKEFEIDLEEAVKRDLLRQNSVGREVIYKQYLQWLEYKGFEKYVMPTGKKCVIVDVDGTIANSVGIRGPFEWHKVDQDKPISEVMDIVDGLYKMGYHIVFLSGRDSVCYDATKKWLEKYFNFPIELYMRERGDMRKDYIVKLELFRKYVANNYAVWMVIDDRKQTIEQTWTPLGLKVINVGKIHERF